MEKWKKMKVFGFGNKCPCEIENKREAIREGGIVWLEKMKTEDERTRSIPAIRRKGIDDKHCTEMRGWK